MLLEEHMASVWKNNVSDGLLGNKTDKLNMVLALKEKKNKAELLLQNSKFGIKKENNKNWRWEIRYSKISWNN